MSSLRSRLFEQRWHWAQRLYPYSYRLLAGIEGSWAARAQAKYCRTYIGITGSCGKSTTAQLLAAALAGTGTVARGSLINIERAVFRTLRKLDRPVDYLVQEISAGGGPGYLTRMLDKLRIDIGIVTAIGKEHRAAFPDIESIAQEKGRLVEAVHPGGLSILNADDPLVKQMAPRAGGRVVLYGRAADAEVRAENIVARWPQRLAFDLVIGPDRWRVETRFAGTMMVSNVLAALAVVHGLGLDIAAAVARIAAVEPVFEHMSIHAGGDGHTYLLDTNKAPLWSTDLVVSDLANLGGPQTVFVMAQISDTYGDRSQWYRKLLRRASKSVGTVIALDMAAKQAAKLIEDEGIANIVCADTIEDARNILDKLPPSLVVIKSAEITKLSRLFHATQQPVTCARRHCELTVHCQSCPLLSEA